MSTINPTASLRREDYKAIKHMDKAQLTNYLSRIYMRGYEAGQKAVQAALPSVPAEDANISE